ncbi:hypothetical protein pclt_cds_373 [Pandoravirus celtis]|uniref:Uncharacterized protein n=1 Tax=Pandoravirus celtis TaxID=2568002 RepID=A0A4D6EHQ3_9VIRU|nr:hypothetical protein pclt_cds_373 [Pandoravirus celtis]
MRPCRFGSNRVNRLPPLVDARRSSPTHTTLAFLLTTLFFPISLDFFFPVLGHYSVCLIVGRLPGGIVTHAPLKTTPHGGTGTRTATGVGPRQAPRGPWRHRASSPRRRPVAGAVAPPTTAEQEREQQRQAEEAEAEAENEEERLAALDLALSTIPAEIRQALPLVDTRVLLESQVGLRLADTVAEVERLRADFARADAERERLLSYVNQLEQIWSTRNLPTSRTTRATRPSRGPPRGARPHRTADTRHHPLPRFGARGGRAEGGTRRRAPTRRARRGRSAGGAGTLPPRHDQVQETCRPSPSRRPAPPVRTP